MRNRDSFKIRDLAKQNVHSLAHLLPYDPQVKKGERLTDGLREYLLLLIAAEEAAKLFLRGDLECFDPLVGESACQIRALKLVLMLEYTVDIDLLLKSVLHSKAVVSQLLTSNSIQKKKSLHEVIEKEKINIHLNDGELYLIKSYLLSKVKTPRDSKPEMPFIKNEYTDPKKIKEISDVGRMFSENLVEKLREKTSASSVRFVQKIASRLSPSESVVEMVSDKYLIKHRGLDCLPCYWVTKVLMQEALHRGIPLVMQVEQMAKDKNHEIRYHWG